MWLNINHITVTAHNNVFYNFFVLHQNLQFHLALGRIQFQAQ